VRVLGSLVPQVHGASVSIAEVADALSRLGGVEGSSSVTGTARLGDVRHAIADTGRAQRLLGYQPRVPLEDGLEDLMSWFAQQKSWVDRSAQAQAELQEHDLLRSAGLDSPASDTVRA
jgi:dTDP-L-rhamnose 4-epimerase